MSTKRWHAIWSIRGGKPCTDKRMSWCKVVSMDKFHFTDENEYVSLQGEFFCDSRSQVEECINAHFDVVRIIWMIDIPSCVRVLLEG